LQTFIVAEETKISRTRIQCSRIMVLLASFGLFGGGVGAAGHGLFDGRLPNGSKSASSSL